MQVIVDNLLTHYEAKGKGKLVVLLHGWGDDLTTFRGLQTELSRGYHVVALDLPGFGTSQPPVEVWNLDNYASFVRHFLEKLDLQQPYAVIGHSNGGALAIRAMSKGKLKPERAVLLAASGIRDQKAFRRLVFKVVAKTGKLATFWLPRRHRQALRKLLYGTVGSDLLVAQHLQETFKRTVRQDVQTDAAKLRLPVLLIFGDQDTAVPLADGERYSGLIKNSKLKVIEGAEHFVHHDHPQAVAKAIKEFLEWDH